MPSPGSQSKRRVAAIWDQRTEDDRKEVLARIPMGRLGELDELGAAVAYLY